MKSESYHTENNIFHFIPHSTNGEKITIMIGNKSNQAYPTLSKEELKGLADFIYNTIQMNVAHKVMAEDSEALGKLSK
jgi:hypothetical protein